MNIDDFITNNKPRSKKSVFDEHIEDINKLLELNYSQKQVIEFLQNKVKNKAGLSEQNLSFYLRKSRNKTNSVSNIVNYTEQLPIKNKTVTSAAKIKNIEEPKKSSFQEDAMSFFRSLKED